LALMIRPKFNMLGEESIDDIINQDTGVGPKELLVDQLKGYGDSNVNQLAVDLYDFLSKDKIDESKELVDQFFNEFYNKSKDDVEFKTEEVETEEAPQEKSEDVQVTFNEVLK